MYIYLYIHIYIYVYVYIYIYIYIFFFSAHRQAFLKLVGVPRFQSGFSDFSCRVSRAGAVGSMGSSR